MSNPPVVICMGEILVDLIASPRVDALEKAAHFVPHPGGAPANVAVGVQRLGVRSAFAGMVGRDAFGRLLANTLDGEGVDTRSLCATDAQPTTLAFVALSEAGVPDFSFYRHPGADLSIRMKDVDPGIFDAAKVFHFGSLSLTSDPARTTTMELLALAREKGLFVTYDPNYRPALWTDEVLARKRMAEPLAHVDLLKVSEDELALLSGTRDLAEGCATLAACGPKHIVVTRGGAGMTGCAGGELMAIPAEPVDVVDTTGCGDASMAGIIVHVVKALPELGGGAELPPDTFRTALHFANRCAGLAATRPGAIPSLPRAAELGD